jgi:uncharacterized membrane protein
MQEEEVDLSIDRLTFRRRAVRPMECLREGWQMIRDYYWLFLGITLVALLISQAAAIILTGPLTCGIYLCLLRRARGRDVTFDMLFQGFEYFVPSLIATLIMIVPVVIFAMVVLVLEMVGLFAAGALMAQGGPPNRLAIVGLWAIVIVFALVFYLVILFVNALFVFTMPLIVDRKLSGLEAVKLSARAVMANLRGVVLLLLLETLVCLGGALLCCVGAYFVLPLQYAMVTIAYLQVFSPEPEVPAMVEEVEPAPYEPPPMPTNDSTAYR